MGMLAELQSSITDNRLMQIVSRFFSDFRLLPSVDSPILDYGKQTECSVIAVLIGKKSEYWNVRRAFYRSRFVSFLPSATKRCV